ncbi:HAD family hydrolase [Sphingopyxis sp.]|uniref:HAD family hydrolase n=1 Tax=Sphingopyxis sp. TaxID=1908224 RepID=UPI001D984729|nr:HAD family hydrolase [Sphingopyxis sp.]MBW8295558.1 HAD family hydrolase [Sphingopyxis sp.]
MAIASGSRTIVFDLDDTLYAEADYVLSGKNALRELLTKIYRRKIDPSVFDEADFIAALCRELGLPSSAAQTMIWHYRLHEPKIALRAGAAALIEHLRARGDRICIITDGRSVTQRLKILALGLDVDGVYISEEVGAEKPDPSAFVLVERDWPAESYVYVADNVAKDFIAARARRWISVGIRADSRAIYGANPLLSGAVMPDLWADDFHSISKILLSDGE